jgi:hypothetical protein
MFWNLNALRLHAHNDCRRLFVGKHIRQSADIVIGARTSITQLAGYICACAAHVIQYLLFGNHAAILTQYRIACNPYNLIDIRYCIIYDSYHWLTDAD